MFLVSGLLRLVDGWLSLVVVCFLALVIVFCLLFVVCGLN